MRTALAADEPDPPPFATGGIVTGPGYTLSTDGCVWPNGPRTVAYPAGNVSVTIAIGPAMAQEIARQVREPFRTTAWVDKPREIEA